LEQSIENDRLSSQFCPIDKEVMKIIQIIDLRWYNACADFAVKQALGLSLVGNDVLLMANPGSPPAIKAREAGLNVSEKINFAGAGRIFTNQRKLRKIAKDFGADILFAHRGESHLAAALSARGTKFRVARFRGDVRPPRAGLFSRYLNNRLTKGIAVSTEKLKIEYENKFGSIKLPCRVIYPAIESSRFKTGKLKDKLKLKFGLKADNPVVGIVGRLSPVKGHRYFIEAAKIVALKYPQVQYIIAGEDAQIKSAELQISAALLKIPNIHFMGRVDNVEELISAFDIGVVSSIGSEMICRVLLEYFAAGLPTVGTSVNQISEIMLQSDGGILVPPADSVAMGNAIIELLSNQERSRMLAVNGSRWVTGRSLKELGRESEEFLAEVLNA
jgi:glycosyltransferase involved in cell wall biosynthesis